MILRSDLPNTGFFNSPALQLMPWAMLLAGAALAGFGLIAAGVAVLALGYRRPESTDPASDSGCQHPAKTP